MCHLQNSLQRGTVPSKDAYEWPAEPFQSQFKDTMINLEMPRFCRNYPKLTDALLRDMLGLVDVRPGLHCTCFLLMPADTVE